MTSCMWKQSGSDSRILVLIPAYEPGERLLSLLDGLQSQRDYEILLVNDGSGETTEEIFEEARKKGCTVLEHEKNRGKGAALKTGFAWIQKERGNIGVIVTADCDGQHTVRDIIRIAESVKTDRKELVLGSRTFQGEVPGKSRIGNTVSRKLFTLFTGVQVWDTQTGLRGFPALLLPWLLSIPGGRFEYEQNMLFECKRQGCGIREIPIETVYENENRGTHFHPVRDSLLVAMCFLRFSAVSLVCAILDFLLVGVLYDWTSNLFLAVVSTRLCTASTQYLCNHFLVFREAGTDMKSSSWRYALLAGVVLVLNYFLLRFFTAVLGMPLFVSKLLTETILFAGSFGLQKTFVFAGKYQYNG